MTEAEQLQLKLKARARLRLAQQQAPKQDGLDKAVGVATEFAEGMTGWGTELGAFGSQLGSSVYDLLNSDKSASEILDNFGGEAMDRAFERIQGSQDKFEAENPLASDLVNAAGMVTSIAAIPAGAATKAGAAVIDKVGRVGGTALVGAAEGALYGAGSDENRAEGAALGAVLGGGVGAIGGKVSDWLGKRAEMKADELAQAGDDFVETAVKTGEWTDRTTEGWNKAWSDVATGVSDAITRRISPEIGGRVQRFDETASRMNTKATRDVLETAPMRKVLELEAGDTQFKGMLLDYARHSGDTTKLTNYVKEALGGEEAAALGKYLRWSQVNNAKYNKMLGNNEDATGYLHTQKRTGLPGEKPLPKKQAMGEWDDDVLNMPVDQAAKDRQRGLFSKGEVRPEEYESVLLTNANRIFNNTRLLQAQEKFGVGALNGGAAGLMDAIEKTAVKKGISEEGAREARNAMVSLIKGQNKSPNVAIKTVQNLGYSVLGGPKTAILNLHDIPVAAWNNGLKSARGLFKDGTVRGADVERLGIDAQGVGEFVQRMHKNSLDKSWGRGAEDLSQKYTKAVLTAGGFRWMDRFAKNQTLKMIADNTVTLAKGNKLAERWGTYFDPQDLAFVQEAIAKTDGNIDKMGPKAQKLYDEILTLGLGQQQLISAAGRPIKWLDNPNLRPLWMMRGFAVKHNHLISEKVHRKWKSGDKAGAAMEAGKYVMLPGAAYAAMNVARNEVFKEDYEPSGEELMWSLADSVLGPMTLNAVGVGSSYARNEYTKDPWRAIATAAIPPGGVGKDVVNGVYRAVAEQDEEELVKIFTAQPIYKQWMAGIESVSDAVD